MFALVFRGPAATSRYPVVLRIAHHGSCAPTLTAIGAVFSVAACGVMFQVMAAPPDGSSDLERIAKETSCTEFE